MTDYTARFEARRRSHGEILDVVDRLVAEFRNEPAGAIIRNVASARELLLRCGVRENLPHLVEALVRRQLAERVPA